MPNNPYDPSFLEELEKENEFLNAPNRSTSNLRIALKTSGDFAVLRLLPYRFDEKGRWYARQARHWVNNRPYLCTRDTPPEHGGHVDGKCRICDLVDDLLQDKDKNVADIAYKMTPVTQYLTWAIMYEKQEGRHHQKYSGKEVKIAYEWWHYKEQFQELMAIYKNYLRRTSGRNENASLLSIIDPVTGCDLTFERLKKRSSIERGDPIPIAPDGVDPDKYLDEILSGIKLRMDKPLKGDALEEALIKFEDAALGRTSRRRSTGKNDYDEENDDDEGKSRSSRRKTDDDDDVPATRSTRSEEPVSRSRREEPVSDSRRLTESNERKSSRSTSDEPVRRRSSDDLDEDEPVRRPSTETRRSSEEPVRRSRPEPQDEPVRQRAESSDVPRRQTESSDAPKRRSEEDQDEPTRRRSTSGDESASNSKLRRVATPEPEESEDETPEDLPKNVVGARREISDPPAAVRSPTKPSNAREDDEDEDLPSGDKDNAGPVDAEKEIGKPTSDSVKPAESAPPSSQPAVKSKLTDQMRERLKNHTATTRPTT